MTESGKLKCVELPLAVILILNEFLVIFYNLLCSLLMVAQQFQTERKERHMMLQAIMINKIQCLAIHFILIVY